MGMKWKYFRILTLFALIFLSMFLTWQIWTAGDSFGESSQTPSRTDRPSVTFERAKAHVFGPTQVVVHNGEELLASTNEMMLTQLEKGLSEWTITGIDNPLQLSKKSFQEMMERNSGLELVFEGQVPFGLFQKVFSRMPREYENQTFNRAFVPFNNNEKVYFYDSVTHMLYETDIEGLKGELIQEIAYNEEADYTEVQGLQIKNRNIYLPVDPIEVNYRDYMIERLPNSLFVNLFFRETSEVDVRRSTNVTRYLDYVSEMRINEDTSILTYRKQQSSQKNTNLSGTLEQGFNELTRFEKWTEEIHFHNYNPETGNVTFRRYLGGWPVFGYFDYGEVQVRSEKEDLTYLRMPLEVVRTPIAQVEDSQKVTLASGAQVIAQLEAAGISLNTIENIRIGLDWQPSEESSQVVRFSPNWYILEQGNWIEIDRYVARQRGGKSNGL